MGQTISQTDFEALMTIKKINIIDVREEHEYHLGHIPNVLNIPLSRLSTSLDQFKQDETYYLVCQSGGRSQMACMMLAQLGINAINVQGGMMEWRGPIE
ncbi:rhodanese-like domain-containing protein [Vagococcus silagei]|uniref:Rhodanese-like domain-containing protein n=1 Tax=Vagococcus silagei TaxID=2508885 RepID=A0A4S3B1U1_9ENTE|nr:rhodanese-like domain-containing protein [Vagococcus silagei]THB61074.1 rhodanese-like domain-containing protein [Vagococcus silagei]